MGTLETLPVGDDEPGAEDDMAVDPEVMLLLIVDDDSPGGYGETMTVLVETVDSDVDGTTGDEAALDIVRLETWPADSDAELVAAPLLVGEDVDASIMLEVDVDIDSLAMLDIEGMLLGISDMLESALDTLLDIELGIILDILDIALLMLLVMLLSTLDALLAALDTALEDMPLDIREELLLGVVDTLESIEPALEEVTPGVLVVEPTPAAEELDVLIAIDEELVPGGLYEPPLRMAANTSC